jgi:hypothetical protein
LSNAEKERLKPTFGANTDAGNSFGGWKWTNSSGLELILWHHTELEMHDCG